MTPAARIAAVIEILVHFENTAKVNRSQRLISAHKFLRHWFRRRRYIGSGDRAKINEFFWMILRCRARLRWHVENSKAEINPRNIVLAFLVIVKQQHLDLPKLFTNVIRYAPEPLSFNEKELVEELRSKELINELMPAHVRFEWPEWLLNDAVSGLGQTYPEEFRALSKEPPTDIRLNTLLIKDRFVIQASLSDAQIKVAPTKLSPLGLRLNKRARFENLLEWKNGLFEVQDEGSQIAALLCDARPGMQVADVCSGAGGKLLVMAARMNNKGRILALDVNSEKLNQSKIRLRRAKVQNVEQVLVKKGWSNERWTKKFDRVVVDAPCSGSGTWRRQVDARWSLTPQKFREYKEAQSDLLENARAMVAPEGRIIYITCSFLASEGQEQIKNLMVKAPELELVRIEKVWERTVLALGGGNCPPTDGKFLQLTPGKNRTDGFFIAILRACHAY